jgi:methylthioribose-1-phosphate isomerase
MVMTDRKNGQDSARVPTLRWEGGPEGQLWLIDQTLLPLEVREIACRTVQAVWDAIKRLAVRGAPAIGVSAAYGVVLGLQAASPPSPAGWLAAAEAAADHLATSRPTAVNLFWALNRMRQRARELASQGASDLPGQLLREAQAIEAEDQAMCRAIGLAGAALLPADCGVLTHCNAGGLATADYGTALAVFFAAHEQGKTLRVFADETRPLLQGARLTSWECQQRGLDVTVICDSMAAQVMREGRIQAVVVGADRIAANGDTANKIGTYSVAVLARHHGIPFYVAAPSSTFDWEISSGQEIPIEHRQAEEISRGFGRQTVPTGVKVYNPAFDVTPHDLITSFITERGVIMAPFAVNLPTRLRVG